MLCARVMRGSSSRANSETPLAAISAANLGRAQRIAHADDHLARAIEFQIGAAGLGIGPGGPDLEQDVGGEDLARERGDLGPFVDILLVGIAGRLARPGLDQHFHARP